MRAGLSDRTVVNIDGILINAFIATYHLGTCDRASQRAATCPRRSAGRDRRSFGHGATQTHRPRQ
jgi:hypothetical protein